MRSRIVVAVVCGLVTSVAVAWATAAFVDPAAPGSRKRERRVYEGCAWRIQVDEQRFQTCVFVGRVKGSGGYTHDSAVGSPADVVSDWFATRIALIRPDTPSGNLIGQATGWPLLCLRSERTSMLEPRLAPGLLQVTGGIPIASQAWEITSGIMMDATIP